MSEAGNKPSRRDLPVAAQGAPPGSEAGDPMSDVRRATSWKRKEGS